MFMIGMTSGLLDEIEIISILAPSVFLFHSKREQTRLLSFSLFILTLVLIPLFRFLIIYQTYNLTMDEDDFIHDEAEVSGDEISSDESDDGEEEGSNCDDEDEASDPRKEQQLRRRLQQ